jgi:hypothetical protein
MVSNSVTVLCQGSQLVRLLRIFDFAGVDIAIGVLFVQALLTGMPWHTFVTLSAPL